MTIEISEDGLVNRIAWDAIECVLLDMDGTLLDLRFDNTFWQHTIPIHYARLHAITPDEAVEILAPIFHREAGNLNWYCLDFWSEQLGFDVAQLKRTESHGIAWRPEAEQFLKQLSASHCEVILVTNAHPDTLAIKMDVVNLDPWFDHVVSSHYFRAPKESLVFWDTLRGKHGFNPDTTLFIDDSEPILASAGEYGIRHLITLLQPDSTLPPREATDYPAIRHFSDITEGLPHAR